MFIYPGRKKTVVGDTITGPYVKREGEGMKCENDGKNKK